MFTETKLLFSINFDCFWCNFQNVSLTWCLNLLRFWCELWFFLLAGGRIRKNYCLVKNKSIQKTRYMLTWVSSYLYLWELLLKEYLIPSLLWIVQVLKHCCVELWHRDNKVLQLHITMSLKQGIINSTGTETFANESKLVKLMRSLKSTLVPHNEKSLLVFLIAVFWVFS